MRPQDTAAAGGEVQPENEQIAGLDVVFDALQDAARSHLSPEGADAAIFALAKHEGNVADLVKLTEHALTVYRAHGYWIAAEHLEDVLKKMRGTK